MATEPTVTQPRPSQLEISIRKPYTYIADERLPHEADNHLHYTMVANPLWLDDKFGGSVVSDEFPDTFAMTDNAEDGKILPQDDSA